MMHEYMSLIDHLTRPMIISDIANKGRYLNSTPHIFIQSLHIAFASKIRYNTHVISLLHIEKH